MKDNHLKALSKTDDELRVANYMVMFGGKDLYDEYFTPHTEFESNYTKTGRLLVDWEHGLDWQDEVAPQRDDVLGYVDWKTAKVDEMGLWVERVLSRQNEYMQYLEELIEEGIVGTSSEAVPGKVRRTNEGEIQVWPLKRDALTVTPAEPRMMKENVIGAIKALSEKVPHLKALLQDQEMVEAGEDGEKKTKEKANYVQVGPVQKNEYTTTISDPDGTTWIGVRPEKNKIVTEVDTMTEEIKVDNVEASPDYKVLSDKIDAFLDQIVASPKLKDVGYVAPDSETDHAEVKTFGDFLVSIRNQNHKRLTSVYKAAMAEGAGATGGYMVPTEWGGQLLGMAKEYNALRKAGAVVSPMTSDKKEFFLRDIETAGDAGDSPYAGGVIAYWTEEAASITESEPKFRQVILDLHKLAAFSLASNEVIADADERIDGMLAQAFAMAVGSKEEYAFFRGNGVGKPKGIMTSGALISATRSAASAVALGDLSQMMSDLAPSSWSSASWFVSPTVVDQLIQLVTNPLTWLSDLRQPWQQSALLGLPWYVVGCLPSLGTTGDIMLVDPKYYLIGDREGIAIAYSEHYKFQNDQGAWRVIKRVDGQPMIDNAITVEEGTATVSPFVVLTTSV